MIEKPNQNLPKGEATRNRIIDAAYHLFLEHGYHGTSMRQIVEQADITMGGIYNHFSGKEDLWKAVLFTKHPYHEIMPLLQNARGDTVADLIHDGAHRMVEELGKRPDLLNLMFIELVEFKGKDIPEIFLALQPEVVKLGEVLARTHGKLRKIPPPTLIRSFAGFFFSYYITGLLTPPSQSALFDERTLDDFIDIYLYGIMEHDEKE